MPRKHPRAAPPPEGGKTIGVSADLLGLLWAEHAMATQEKRGLYYLVNQGDLPDGPTLIALARDRYRQALTQAAAAAKKLGSEAQAVLFDARDGSSTASPQSARSATTSPACPAPGRTPQPAVGGGVRPGDGRAGRGELARRPRRGRRRPATPRLQG